MTWTKKILPLAAVLAVVLPAGNAMAAPKSKFRFSAPSYITQEGGTLKVTVTRVPRHGHSKTNQISTVDWAITGGSATNGTDYTTDIAAGKLTFGTNETTKDITFTVNQDFDIEGVETVGLKLSGASSNALITNPRTAQVLIADDDGPTQIQLAPATQSINESIGTANFYAVRSGDVSGASSVDYATSDGTAQQPGDYTSTSGTATFAKDEFQKPINVPVIDDHAIENPETFSVGLSNVLGATLGSASATVTIVDNDSQPVFALDASSYSVNEDGSVDVTVQRLGNATSPNPISANDVFTVDWTTADGTATNPADYLPSADDQLEFDSTDDTETITISATAGTQIGLVDDALVEGDETFGLALANPAVAPGGSGVVPALGSPSSATVTIHDNDTTSGGGGNNTGGGGSNTGGGGSNTGGGGSNTGGSGDNTGGGNTNTGGDTNTPVVATETDGQNPGEQIVLGARESACGLTTKAAKKQKLLKSKSLKLSLKSAKACKVTITTTIKQVKAKKKTSAKSARVLSFKGKKASVTLQPGKAKTVKVTFSKKSLAAIKKALKARKQLVATVVVTTRDSASKLSRKTLKITIKR